MFKITACVKPSVFLKKLIALNILNLSFFCMLAQAQMTIDISGVGGQRYPISIAAFGNELNAAQPISQIIKNDLERSGKFIQVDPGINIASENEAIDFAPIAERGANALVAGQAILQPSGEFELRFRLYDVATQQSLGGLVLTGLIDDQRMIAHKAADFIYEKITQIPGAFATKIAYVNQVNRNSSQIRIADSDGANERVVVTSKSPIISLRWSPKGQHIAYVTLLERPIVNILDLTTGTSKIVSNLPGNNSSPTWAPDGQKLLLSLSLFNGLSQIASTNIYGSAPVRLSHSKSIDTESCYSPDGTSIFFTSDRSGGSQIFQMSAQGEQNSEARRISFEGRNNTSPALSADGKWLAYVGRNGNEFNLQLQNLATGQVQTLAQGQLITSPSFAPNSQTILYSKREQNRSMLAIVPIEGGVSNVLPVSSRNAVEPAWGPFH